MEPLLVKFAKELEKYLSPAVEKVLEDVYIYDMDNPSSWDVDPKKTIAVTDKTDLSELIHVVYSLKLNHVVCSSRDNFFYEIFSSALLLKYPGKFLNNPYLFFLDEKRNPGATKCLREKKIKFNNSSQKPKLMLEIKKFCDEHRSTKKFRDKILTIGDELISNALFDAPVDAKGRFLFKKADRLSYVSYNGEDDATLRISHDENNIIISCEDPFGSIDEEALKYRLYEIYYKKESSPRLDTVGKGLGVKMMWENSCSIYFIVEKSKRSFVCCFFPLGKGRKNVELTPKNFHYCEF